MIALRSQSLIHPRRFQCPALKAHSPSTSTRCCAVPAEGLGRFSINKTIHGDLEAATIGEMFTGGDPKQGAAGYVAIEIVTAKLNGKHGSFALQHFATMDGKGPSMQVIAVPGSGTGELKGIEGAFTIRAENGQH